MQTHRSLPEAVQGHGRTYADDVAVVCGDRRVSWQQFARMVHQGAQALRASGVRAGDRIAYMDKNDWQFPVLSLAAMEAGVALVPLNWRLSGPEIAHILRHSQSVLAVVGEEFVEHFTVLRPEVPLVREMIVAGQAAAAHRTFDEWLAGAPAEPLGEAFDEDAVCFQMYTSGTTGQPKGAMITNRNVAVAMPVTAASWAIDPRSAPLVSSPVFHIAGIAYALAGLWNAGRLVVVRDATPENLLDAIETHGVTSSLIVPAMILMLVNSPRAHDTDLSSLRRIAYGAAPISQDVLHRAIELFRCEFVQAYGLTETTGVVVELPPEVHRPGYARPERLRGAGVPLPGVDIQITGPDGVAVPDGEAGEIWIRSGQNLIGYWADATATAHALPGDGWFRSGDIGYVEDGFLFINDRVKDMIISGGENVYSAEVENALMSHPDIADCAAIGVPHERWGETVKAVVVLREGAPADVEGIQAHCRGSLAGFKVPTSCDFVDALPRNAAGKILKRELREKYWPDATRMIG